MLVFVSLCSIKVRGREREDRLIQLVNHEGAWPNRTRELLVKVAPEEKTGNCPHQSKIKAFFLNY